MASFFKNFEFFHLGVRQTKNIMVRCPLFFTYRKNLQNLPWVGFEPTLKTVERFCTLFLTSSAIQFGHQDLYMLGVISYKQILH